MSTDEPSLWTVPDGGDDMPVTLDGLDAIELAELLAFTTDALGWRGADAIRADLAAHLRRWATRLHPLAPPPDRNGQHVRPSVSCPAGAIGGSLADSS
jgi:hypothetical protein